MGIRHLAELHSTWTIWCSRTNKLDHINDSVSSSNYTTDIDDQSSGNYKYDSIGELISDDASNISHISWTVYGKIASIAKSGDTTIFFTYDAGGNRISKSVVHAGDTLTTWYVRDVQGNVLSVYTYGDPAVKGKDLTQTELHVYGSSRLGILKTAVDVEGTPAVKSSPLPPLGTIDSLIFTRGNKLFELTNHLGNVLATISDKRYGVSMNDSTVNYFIPEVVSANDYYPFGSLQPNRLYTESGVGSYRFGFNGQEKSDEIKGPGNSYTAEFWEYDPRIGRRWNVDPKPNVSISTYATFANNPIANTDVKGDSIPTKFYDEAGKQMDKIPASVLNSFKNEYGINLGYNANTGMLYGEYNPAPLKTDIQVPLVAPLANNMGNEWLALLGTTNVSNQLIVGYDLGVGTKGTVPDAVRAGQSNLNGNAIIDLADFRGDYSLKAFDYGNTPSRSYNLARVMEHEFLGHAIRGIDDKPNDIINPGPNENFLNNIKITDGIIRRGSYYNNATNTISFGDYRLQMQNVGGLSMRLPVFDYKIILNATANKETQNIHKTFDLQTGSETK